MRPNPGIYIALFIGIASLVMYLSSSFGGSLLNTDLGSGLPGAGVKYPESREEKSQGTGTDSKSKPSSGLPAGSHSDDKMTLVTGAGLAVGFLVFGNIGSWLKGRKRKKFQSYMEKQFKDTHH